jgi:hypothetical protein
MVSRLYKYVSYKKSLRGKAGWVAQVKIGGQQTTLGGIHKKQIQAARAAAKALKVPVDSLRLSAAPPARAQSSKKYVYRQSRGHDHTSHVSDFCTSAVDFLVECMTHGWV